MMIKAEAHKDGEGYWVDIIDTNNVGNHYGYMKIDMQQAEDLKYALEAILYEYDCMVDAHTNANYPEDP